MKGRNKKVKLSFIGDTKREDLLIGSHGNTEIKVTGNFQLSGIVYCPKYTITLNVKGDGKISLRGKCYRIVIRKMQGDCLLDLSEVTYRELNCESLGGKAVVIAGNTRAITPAFLSDDAVLQINEHQLIFNHVKSGNSKIVTMTGAELE